jgi:hypothetical protein
MKDFLYALPNSWPDSLSSFSRAERGRYISEEAREQVILRSYATKNLKFFASLLFWISRTRSAAKSAIGQGHSEGREGSQAKTLDSPLRSE